MKIAVLLSGGVDSSVALMRVKNLYPQAEIRAFYLKIWLEEELTGFGACPWEEDVDFARRVCDQADVTLEIVPLQRAYRERIIAYTLDELRAGHTPSPDVLCNREIKMGAFLEAVDFNADRVATGHYSRVRPEGTEHHLLRSRDAFKDQTYFLASLRQDQLARLLFPVGDLTKAEVRAMAKELALPTSVRKDSQGLCFLGKIPFDEFIRVHLGDRPGLIRHRETGDVLGQHRGYWFHTIGQRRGLGLSGGPWFVVSKNVVTNEIEVSHREDLQPDPILRLGPIHWIGTPSEPGLVEVKLRHGPNSQEAQLIFRGEDTAKLRLSQSDAGVAAGQFAVFYRGERCLGNAVIHGVGVAG